MGGLIRNFEKGTKSIGTWFGIDKNKTGHLTHGIAGTPDPLKLIAQKVAKKKADAVLDSANALYAGSRQRQRASALATGAGPSGSAATTSAMAYGLPTLGG